MKKILFMITFACIMLSSCEKETVSHSNESSIKLTEQQLKMRSALEKTTHVMLQMIVNDKEYFNILNERIVKGSPGCLEDRVLIKDLNSSTKGGHASYVKADSQFAKDFKNAFDMIRPQKVNASSEISFSMLENPDSLIQYLEDNNVSLYCPLPLDYYDENNRIPAITFHPIDNDSVNTGYLLNENGEISVVNVCQDYNNLHPVWIMMPNETIITNNTKQNAKSSKNILGYEVSVMRVYVKEYYGGIFDGDLNLHIIRANPSSVTYNSSTNTYTGGIVTDISFKLPRSYVWNAKHGWWSGWYVVNSVWHTNWDISETSHIMYIYEWDKKGTKKKTIPLNTYNANGQVNGSLGTLEYTSQSQDETIGLQQWSRNWFFDIINNGNPTWYWEHSSGNTYSEIEGDNIIRINPDFFMTMRVREY